MGKGLSISNLTDSYYKSSITQCKDDWVGNLYYNRPGRKTPGYDGGVDEASTASDNLVGRSSDLRLKGRGPLEVNSLPSGVDQWTDTDVDQ